MVVFGIRCYFFVVLPYSNETFSFFTRQKCTCPKIGQVPDVLRIDWHWVGKNSRGQFLERHIEMEIRLIFFQTTITKNKINSLHPSHLSPTIILATKKFNT